MSRRYERSEVAIDDRRESQVSRNGRRYDDRYFEEDIQIRRGMGPAPTREREKISESRTPDFLREDYGRTSGAGPLVLRAREREDFEFVPRPRRRSPSPEPPKQEREEIIIRRDERSESRHPPRARERSREREEIIIRRDEREPRRPPPPPEPSRDREEIIIRREEREPRRPPPREPSREREEIIIRREEREPRRPPPREPSREREEIIIRREEREPRRPPPREPSREREEIIIRREEREPYRPPPPPPPVAREREEIIIRRNDADTRSRYDDDVVSRRDYGPPRGGIDREEIIIRRNDQDDDTRSRYTSRRYEDDFAVSRPVSRERARSRGRSGSISEEEIIIRREERQGRYGERDRQEIIIRKTSRSRSPSPVASVRLAPAPAPAPEPQVIYAPQIHQEVITHHRHVDHGFELALTRPNPPPMISRPPSPPSPPPPPPPAPRQRSEERIEIRREGVRNGRAYEEDIIIDRNEGARSVPPPARERYYEPPARREPSPPPPVPRQRPGWEERAMAEEAEYYNQRAMERAYPGEAYHGATRDWAIVDVPPGTRRVKMDGAGGGAQEITWQRYNGIRRSKFIPDGSSDEGYGSEVGRPALLPAQMPAPATGGDIGRRYGRQKDPREGLWTEITKDLVVKEAIQEMGYEFEETDDFYYVIAFLRYEDIARLVGLSEDIRKDRRKRVKEIEWENRVGPPVIEPLSPRLAIEPPPRIASPAGRGQWNREDERYIEREIVYRGGRAPPAANWRR